MIEVLLINESYTNRRYARIVAAVDEVCNMANTPCYIRRIVRDRNSQSDLAWNDSSEPGCLILLGSFDNGLTDDLDQRQRPWVALANCVHGDLAADAPNYVHFDDRDCLAKATSCLLNLEHSSIALLADPSSSWEQHLTAAYAERMRLEGLTEQLILLRTRSDPYLTGFGAMSLVYRLDPRPTALLIAGYESAEGIWRAWNRQHAITREPTSLFLLSGLSSLQNSHGYSQVVIPLHEIGTHLALMAIRRLSMPNENVDPVFVSGRFMEGNTCWPLASPGMF